MQELAFSLEKDLGEEKVQEEPLVLGLSPAHSTRGGFIEVACAAMGASHEKQKGVNLAAD